MTMLHCNIFVVKQKRSALQARPFMATLADIAVRHKMTDKEFA
jgi:hypothetical protein